MEMVAIVAGLVVLIIQICLIVAILQLPGLLRTIIREMKQTRTQVHNDVIALAETIAGTSEVEGE